jgi:redox-sensitive bicupin YhaK (pirin superfamily)
MNESSHSPVELTVGPRLRDLSGFTVNRVWPTARRRLVGPFVFFDHMLQVELPPGVGLDVPPHPHIGLATVTYLFAGEIEHRDSLGTTQIIRPGDLNWMHAGRGIVHSERSSAAARAGRSELHAIQSWVALPRSTEGSAPFFRHYPREQLPRVAYDGISLDLIAGSAFGLASPVAEASELFYVCASLAAGRSVSLEPALGQRAAYIVSGIVRVGATRYEHGQVIVFRDDLPVTIDAETGAVLMLFGGRPLDGDRYVWWNFVSSDPARLEAAGRDWAEGRMATVPGDPERMPLPSR